MTPREIRLRIGPILPMVGAAQSQSVCNSLTPTLLFAFWGKWGAKCGENRNHGKFKIYFLIVEL